MLVKKMTKKRFWIVKNWCKRARFILHTFYGWMSVASDLSFSLLIDF